MSGECIKSIILGASKFCFITFSSPLPIETTKNSCGVKPINVPQKKLCTLTSKIQGERSPMAEFGKGMIKTRPMFCSMLAGSEVSLATTGPCDSSTSKWYCFQTKSYAQVIRMMALLQVIVLLIVLGCGESNTLIGTNIAIVLIAVLSIDLIIFVLLGATPLTIFGNISKWLVWNVKGDAVPSIPYKFVFGTYILALGQILITCNTCDTSLECFQSNIVEYRATLIVGIINSGALAIFRF